MNLTEKLVRTRWLVTACMMTAASATWAELPVPPPDMLPPAVPSPTVVPSAEPPAALLPPAEPPPAMPPPELEKLTPAPIHQASTPLLTQAAPGKERAGHSRKETPKNNVFSGSPKDFGAVPNGCARLTASLCYDYRTGRTVYKASPNLLPEIPGMTPHNLSLHTDRVVVQYTFK